MLHSLSVIRNWRWPNIRMRERGGSPGEGKICHHPVSIEISMGTGVRNLGFHPVRYLVRIRYSEGVFGGGQLAEAEHPV